MLRVEPGPDGGIARLRLAGRADAACLLPTPEQRRRFVDLGGGPVEFPARTG